MNIDLIKSALTLNGPLTRGELINATGLSDRQVKNALDQLQARSGGVAPAGRKKGVQLYGISSERPKDKPRPYVHTWSELRRDPFAHRDLALAGR